MEPAKRARLWRVGFFLALGVAFIFVGYRLRGVLNPLLLAMLIAYVLNPLVNAISIRHGFSRLFGVLIVFILFFSAIGFGLMWAVPRAIVQVESIVEAVPGYYKKAIEWLEKKEILEPEKGKPGAKAPAPAPGSKGVFPAASPGAKPEEVSPAASPGAKPEEAAPGAKPAETPPTETQPPETAPGTKPPEPPPDEAKPPETAPPAPVPPDAAKPALATAPGAKPPAAAPKPAVAPPKPDTAAADRTAAQRLLRQALERLRDSIQKGWEEWKENLPKHATTAFQKIISSLHGLLSVLSYFLLVPLYVFFLLLQWPRIQAWARDLLPSAGREHLLRVIGQIDEATSAFFRGRVVLSLLRGILTGIGFALAGGPSPFLFAVVNAISSFVPVLNVFCVFIPSVLIGALGAENPILGALPPAAVFIGIEVLFEAFVTPFYLGHQVALHPLTLFVALLIGADVFGFFGVIIAVPIACAVKILAREYLIPEWRKLAQREETPPAC